MSDEDPREAKTPIDPLTREKYYSERSIAPTSKEGSPIVFNLRQIAASDIARWDIRNHIVAAADEIERLKRELGEVQKYAVERSNLLGAVAHQGAEIQRLRAALEQIAKDEPDYLAHAVARRALSGEPTDSGHETDGVRAIGDVIAERARQQSVEGWTPEHDDQHEFGELAQAAVCYVAQTAPNLPTQLVKDYWPWDWSWWKPKDRRRDLVRAAALLLAEIERLDRAPKSPLKASGEPAQPYQRKCSRCGKMGPSATPEGVGVYYCSIECAD